MNTLKEYACGFFGIEKAFWKRAIFKKPLMSLFVFSMLALTLLIASLSYPVGSFLWWFLVAGVGFPGYLIVMPMAFYLIDPDLFFPGAKERLGQYRYTQRLERLKPVDSEYR